MQTGRVNIRRNEPCWCGSGKNYKKCHLAADEKLAVNSRQVSGLPARDIFEIRDSILSSRQIRSEAVQPDARPRGARRP
jgi:uncharacterized protein YecA (UPF0149 family)